jgi:hypothetical protein
VSWTGCSSLSGFHEAVAVGPIAAAAVPAAGIVSEIALDSISDVRAVPALQVHLAADCDDLVWRDIRERDIRTCVDHGIDVTPERSSDCHVESLTPRYRSGEAFSGRASLHLDQTAYVVGALRLLDRFSAATLAADEMLITPAVCARCLRV